MHRAAWLVFVLAACGHSADPPPATGSGSGSATPAKPKKQEPILGRVDGPDKPYETPPPVPQDQLDKIGGVPKSYEDLVSIAAGAFVISGPPADAKRESPWFLLDEDPASRYSQLGSAADIAPIVIGLSDEVEVSHIAVDYQRNSLADRVPQRIQVEASGDGSAWKPIVDGELQLPVADGVKLLAKPAAARFLRVTLIGSTAKPSKDGVQELQELHVYGKRTSSDPQPTATGTYDVAGVGIVHLTQTGTEVTGCIDKKQTHIAGAFDGRVLRFLLTEPVLADSGPVVMTFQGPRAFYGFWSGGLDMHSFMTVFDGTKTSDKPGTCPGPAASIAADLAATGRARLYGVTFDVESDKLRDDVKPPLDRLVAVLKAQPKLVIRIEAHSDSVATPPHNQILTAKQAVAVRQYLVAAGIDAKRIEMKAMGATMPLAPASSSLGRAHNRRVEIVKVSP